MTATTKTNDTTAQQQWSSRPAEERFWDVHEMLDAAQSQRTRCLAGDFCPHWLRAVNSNGQVSLETPRGMHLQLGHWSLGQLGSRIGFPAGYVGSLPPELATTVIAHHLNRLPPSDEDKVKLLVERVPDPPHPGIHIATSSNRLRSVTSSSYSRIWDTDLGDWLRRLVDSGWVTPPARPSGIPNERTRTASSADELECAHPNLGIRAGQTVAPAGVYRSDRDSFVFLVDPKSRIHADGTIGYRGIYVSNSEVGARALRLSLFLFDTVCGNHIVWGSRALGDISMRHVGTAREKFKLLGDTQLAPERLLGDPEQTTRAIIEAKYDSFSTKREALQMLTGRHELPKRAAEQIIAIAAEHEERHNSRPLSRWALAYGASLLSQQEAYAGDRHELDKIAGAIVEKASPEIN